MQGKYVLTKSNSTNFLSIQAVNLLLMGSIAALILLRDIAGLSIGRFVFIAVATLSFLLSNKAGMYCLIAFLTPLAPGISATYITAIALVILLFKQRKLHMQTPGLVCMVGILIMELLSAFRGMFSLVEYLRFTGIFVFSFLRMVDLDNDYDNQAMLNHYLLGFWVAMTSILGQMLHVYPLSSILSMGVRFGNTRQLLDVSTEGMLISYNPNGLGYLCLLTALFCLLLYQKSRSKRYIVSFCGATLIGIMTQSRSFILVYIIGIVLYAFLSCRSVKTAIKSTLVLAVGGATVIGAALWLLPEYVSTLLHRFQDADVLNGRGSIMEYYFREMFQYIDRLIFGVGLQGYQEKYVACMSAHNATQEVMIAWGVLGLLLVMGLLLAIFWNGHRQNPKAKLAQYLPLFVYLIAIQSGQGFSDTSGMLRIMVAYSAILMQIDGPVQKKLFQR